MKSGVKWRRVTGALIVFAATSVVPVAPAWALKIPVPVPPGFPTPSINTNCTPPPPVEAAPGTPLEKMLVPAPPDTGGLPPATQFEQRGYAGLAWSVYDPGCGGDVRQPIALVSTYFGNLAMTAGRTLAGVAYWLDRLVSPPRFLHVLDGFMVKAENALYSHVYQLLIGVSLLILALVVIGRATKGDLAASVRALGWALVVMTLATALVQAPTRAMSWSSSAVTSLSSIVPNSLSGANGVADGAASEIVSYVLYPAWLDGMVGTSTGPVAAVEGPKLLAGQSLTFQQAAQVPQPNVSKGFTSAAAQVKHQSQAAYDVLKGQSNPTIRPMSGLFALAGVLLTVPFPIVADILVVASLLIVAMVSLLAVLLAVVGIHERFAELIRRPVMMAVAGVVNAIIFKSAAALVLAAIGFLINPANGLPGQPLTGLLLSGLLAFPRWGIAWVLLQPVMRLTEMMHGRVVNPVTAAENRLRQLTHSVGRVVKTGAVAAVAPGAAPLVAAGGGAAAAVVAERRLRQRPESRVTPDPGEAPASRPARPADGKPSSKPEGRVAVEDAPKSVARRPKKPKPETSAAEAKLGPEFRVTPDPDRITSWGSPANGNGRKEEEGT